jgi:signal transduction histidine kinase
MIRQMNSQSDDQRPNPPDDVQLADLLARRRKSTRWEDRYSALEEARRLPYKLRVEVASLFLADDNAWVRGLAERLVSATPSVRHRTRRGIAHEVDQVLRGAGITLSQRTSLLRLFEETEEAGSFAYLGLAADRAARLVTGALSEETAKEDYIRQLETFLQHIAAYAKPTPLAEKWVSLGEALAGSGRHPSLPIRQERIANSRVNADAVRVILDELQRNARDAGATEVRLDSVASNGHVAINIGNDGSDISEAISTRLFSPWFTTRPGRAGLGLYLAQAASEQAGGRMHLVSLSPPAFEVLLPANQ